MRSKFWPISVERRFQPMRWTLHLGMHICHWLEVATKLIGHKRDEIQGSPTVDIHRRDLWLSGLEPPWTPFKCCEGCQTIGISVHVIRTNCEMIVWTNSNAPKSIAEFLELIIPVFIFSYIISTLSKKKVGNPIEITKLFRKSFAGISGNFVEEKKTCLGFGVCLGKVVFLMISWLPWEIREREREMKLGSRHSRWFHAALFPIPTWHPKVNWKYIY